MTKLRLEKFAAGEDRFADKDNARPAEKAVLSGVQGCSFDPVGVIARPRMTMLETLNQACALQAGMLRESII